MMNNNKKKRVRIIQLVFLLLTAYSLLLTNETHAWQWPWKNYEELVQRNLELRKELLVKEEEKKDLLQERNMLVIHIKELQKEKENLANAVKDIQAAPRSFKEWQAKIDKINKRLDAVTKDRDRLQRELDKAKERLEKLDETIRDEVQKQVEKTRLEKTDLFKSLEKDKAGLQDKVRELERALEEKDKEIEKLKKR